MDEQSTLNDSYSLESDDSQLGWKPDQPIECSTTGLLPETEQGISLVEIQATPIIFHSMQRLISLDLSSTELGELGLRALFARSVDTGYVRSLLDSPVIQD